MRITPFVLVGAVAVAGAATPASAKSRPKPIVKKYDVMAPAPDPSNYAGSANVNGYSVCAQRVPKSFDVHEFKAPALGKLKIELTGFLGDWDLLVTDSKNNEITFGGSDGINTPQSPTIGNESLTTKVKKAKTTFRIVACNWAGSPNAHVKYTFTYT
jgi:hypothetical protein